MILITTIIAFVISNYLFGQQNLTNSEIEEKVNLILSEMTLEEKIGQMAQYSGTSPKYEQMIREGKIGSFLNICGATEANRLQRITLAPNENIKVKFVLHPEQLGFYKYEMEYITEPGKFEVMVGGNSVNLVKTTFEIEQSSN